jgi:hypothetical protein
MTSTRIKHWRRARLVGSEQLDQAWEKIAARLNAHNTPWCRSARVKAPLVQPSGNARISGFPRARLGRGKRRLEISPGRTRGEIAGDAA